MDDYNSQLLCTFSNKADLNFTISEIDEAYSLVYKKIYVLENAHDHDQLILTYNVDKNDLNKKKYSVKLPSTISVHRKKQTNTIYTINAINELILEKNNGVLDKTFKIEWDELRNSVLVTAYGKLKIINTALYKIIEL